MLRSARAVTAAAATLSLGIGVAAPLAHAEAVACHVVDVEFTPASNLQIVAWLETAPPNPTFIDTLFITQLTGTYGIGNRPGMKDFNSAWKWPYGRREFVAPVWAHRHGKTFPKIVYQNNDDTNLSHPFDESSQEVFYCRPLRQGETQWDAQTCTSTVYTDKGRPSTTETSLYPPRADLTVKGGIDDPAVATYKELNPFDAISQATPVGGMDTKVSWPIPPDLPMGDYVVFVEVSQEFDFNNIYNATTYPAPTNIPWKEYGLPARGQPSIVYRVPITIGSDRTVATTSAYAGYGNPEGSDGTLNAPDVTITTDNPGHGAARLQLTDDGAGGMFRVRVESRPEFDDVAPGMPGDGRVAAADERSAVIDFTEPGDDGLIGPVMGYEVRYRAGTPIDDANFFDSMPLATTIDPQGPGTPQAVTMTGLLPQTTYYVGVRAYDECKNYSPIAMVEVQTAERASGYVDACFVATAAYGSLLANDVDMLRRFRDQYLQSNVLGELAVETYYSVGPAVAGVVDQSEQLRGASREALAPLVEFVRHLTAKH